MSQSARAAHGPGASIILAGYRLRIRASLLQFRTRVAVDLQTDGDLDDDGGIDVYFIPIRPGTYEFFVENYRESGMLGRFEIK